MTLFLTITPALLLMLAAGSSALVPESEFSDKLDPCLLQRGNLRSGMVKNLMDCNGNLPSPVGVPSPTPVITTGPLLIPTATETKPPIPFVPPPKPTKPLYNKYGSILEKVDGEVAQFRGGKPAKTDLLRDTNAGFSDSGTFFVGDGFDVIRGVLKENCLNVAHPSFSIVENNAGQESFDVSFVQNNEHLAELLDVSQSARGGFSLKGFSLSASAERNRYMKSVTDNTHFRFVVKFKRRNQKWQLRTPADAIHPDMASSVLSPDDEEAKIDFRERCGDKFVSSADLGSTLYLVFSFDSKRFTYEENESNKYELSATLKEVFDGSGNSSELRKLNTMMSNLRVELNGYQVGGPAGLSGTITPGNVLTKYQEFVRNTDSSNWAAIDYTTSNYRRPNIHQEYPHGSIFADFGGTQGPLAQMTRWLNLSVQLVERCSVYDDHDKQKPYTCGTAEREMGIAMDTCRETREWQDCVHPAQYFMNGRSLLSWMNTNVKALLPRQYSKLYNHHLHKERRTISDNTCLPDGGCFFDKFRGNGQFLGKGVVYTEHKWKNHKKGDDRPTFTFTSSRCLNSSARMRTGKPPFGNTTADWNYTILLHGQCPKAVDFSIF